MSIRALYNEYVITTKPTANMSLSITLETDPYLLLSICANAETAARIHNIGNEINSTTKLNVQ